MRSHRTSSRPHNNFEHQSSRVFFWEVSQLENLSENVGYVQTPRLRAASRNITRNRYTFATASHERNTSPTRNSHMRRRRTRRSFKIARSIVLDQNGNNRNLHARPQPSHPPKQCKFVHLTPLRSVRHHNLAVNPARPPR